MELKPETARKLYIIKLLGCASLLLFSVLLVLYEYDVIKRPISAVFIPLFPVFISLPVSLHFIISNFGSTLRKFTSLMLLSSVYVAAVSIIVFLILVGLSIDESINASWSVVFIPFWFGLFSYLVLCLFLYPGLMSKEHKLQRNAFVIFLYFVVVLTTSILVVMKLDTDNIPNWSVCLVPLWVGLSLHCLSFALFKLKPQTKECFTAEKIFLTYFSFELLLVNLYLEVSRIPLWLVFIPFWLSLGVWLIFIQVQYSQPIPTPEQAPLIQRQQTI